MTNPRITRDDHAETTPIVVVFPDGQTTAYTDEHAAAADIAVEGFREVDVVSADVNTLPFETCNLF